MQKFDYHNPTHIVFGEGRIAELNKLVPSGARVLLLFGGGSVKANGTYDEVVSALKGHTTFEFWGIEPNPTYETLMGAVELGRKEHVDFLLAVGGGSVADGTKFVAAAIPYEGDPWEILETAASKVKAAIPMGIVLTLPATGSEMNSFAVISRKSIKAKLAFGHPLTYPVFSILDPAKTYTLPVRQVQNGIIDTFVHVMEQYLTYPANGMVQDRFAEGLLLTLIEIGPKVVANPTDYSLRANFMWAATCALNGLVGAGVPQDWATHSIGHEITALYGIDHARTLAVVLPSLLDVRREAKRGKLLQYAGRVWGLTEGDESARIDQAIAKTRGFFESMGAPTHLSAYEIGTEGPDLIVKNLEIHGATALGEKRDLTPDVAREILKRSA